MALEHKTKLLELLREYADIFATDLYLIGETDKIQPNFQVDTSKIESKRPYPIPHSLRGEMRDKLDELLKAGIIEPSDSCIVHPSILIKKKNHSTNKPSYRLCQDLRNVNQFTKYPSYNMPRVDLMVQTLRGSELFSSLDLQSSFWQVPLKKEDRKFTAFSTPFGNFQYTKMPQGANYSPGVLQNLTDSLTAPFKNLNMTNYVDDICLGSKSYESMLEMLRKLFDRIREFGLTINPEKTTFMTKEIQFLGHVINGNSIRPSDDNLRKITDFPSPNTKRKVQRFIGLVNYFRKYLNNFSKLASPLTDLLKKNVKFKWGEKEQQAFETLKNKLNERPILAHVDYDKILTLVTDASDHSIAGMLAQEGEDNILHPIHYFSRKLSETEKRYSIYEKEILGMVASIKTFSHYLYGKRFNLKSDNLSATKVKELPTPTNRVTRWLLFLSDYEYNMEFIPGHLNYASDLFSRDFHKINSVIGEGIDIESIKIEQQKDEKLKLLIKKLNNMNLNLTPAEEHYFIRNEILMHIGKVTRAINTDSCEQFVIPETLKIKVLNLVHKPHFAFKKTYQKLRENYFWENMYSETKISLKVAMNVCHLSHQTFKNYHLCREILTRLAQVN